PDDRTACSAIERILGSGIEAAAVELLDAATMRAGGSGYPGTAAPGALILAEAEGGVAEARARSSELHEALGEGALHVEDLGDGASVWRWRDGLSGRLAAARGA